MGLRLFLPLGSALLRRFTPWAAALAATLALNVGAPTLAWAQPRPQPQPQPQPQANPVNDEFEAALDLLRFNAFDKAAEALEALAKKHAGNDLGTQALFFAGRARQMEGKLQAAAGHYRTFLSQFPEHALADKVKFRLADVLIAQGKLAEAAELLADNTRRQSAPEKVRELALRFMTAADRQFDGVEEPDPLVPGKTVRRQDYAAAIRYYQNALEIGLAEADTLKASKRIAESFELLSQWYNAAPAWQRLNQNAALPAAERQEAQYRAAVAFLNAGNPDLAAAELLAIADAKATAAKPADKHPRHADALWLLARLYSNDGWDFPTARNRAEEFLAAYPNDGRVPEVRLWLAEQEMGHGLPTAAAARLQQFIALHADRADDVAKARYLRAVALFGARKFDDAAAAYRAFLERHGNHGLAPQALAGLREVISGKAQFLTLEAKAKNAEPKQREAAIAAWRAFLAAYPTDPQALNVLGAIVELFEAGKDYSGEIEVLRQVAAQYPQAAANATFKIAQLYETVLKEEDRALAEYRRMREQGMDDRGGIARLTGKELTLRTERVFNATEKPTVNLSTRNLESLTGRAFRLDLREYFRRKLTTGNVEALMVDVLKPDFTWTAGIKEFRQYRSLVTASEIPVSEAGAYVVTYSDEKFRGSSLVLVSDLELVVKNASRQVVVLALNARTKQPVAGVELLLISRNGQHIFTGTTNENGVFNLDLTQANALPNGDARRGADLSDLHVFGTMTVKANGSAAEPVRHYAFTSFAAFAAEFQGYTARGFAFTDRPLYRAGERVNFKVVVRNVADGAYVVPDADDAGYRVVCSGPRNEAVWERDVKLSDLGTASDSLALSDEPATGTYTLSFNSKSGRLPNARCTFEVRPFERPEYQIDAQFSSELMAFRETVKLKVVATRYSGAPVANTPIGVRIYAAATMFQPSGEIGEEWFSDAPRQRPQEIEAGEVIATVALLTDADGKAEVEFVPQLNMPPRGARFVRLVAELRGQTDTGRDVTSLAQAAVSATSAFARIGTKQDTVKLGDEVAVVVRAESPLNAPVALAGTLRMYRGEGLYEFDPAQAVATEMVTLSANGRGEVKLRPAEAGVYTLRFEAKGAMNELVIAQTVVRVVTPEETERRDITLLSDKARYFAGEKATLTALVPKSVTAAQGNKGVSALLTVEADRVLWHRVVQLDASEVKFTLEVDAAYMPNVRVALATIAEGRLMVAETGVSVVKLLNLELNADRPSYRPGEEMTVLMRATDQLGRPVAAEVALAVIDEAVFDLQPDATGDIRGFFYNVVRKPAVRTVGTVGWTYQGNVQNVDPDLIAETERKKLADLKKSLRESQEEMSDDGDDELGKADRPADSARFRRNHEGRAAGAMPAPPTAQPGGLSANSRPANDPGSSGDAMHDAGASVLMLQAGETVRADFRFTAAFLASVRTDADGKAVVKIKMPESVSKWRLTARGITKDTQVGDAKTGVQTVLPFYGRIDAPRVATEGDRFMVTAAFFNETGAAGKVTAQIGERRPADVPVSSRSHFLVTLDAQKIARLGMSTAGVAESLERAGFMLRPGAFTTEKLTGRVVAMTDIHTLSSLDVAPQRNRRVMLADVATVTAVPADAQGPVQVDVDTPKGGAATVSMEYLAENIDTVKLLALGQLGEMRDANERAIKIVPFGAEVRTGFTGEIGAQGQIQRRFAVPAGAISEATSFQINVQPTLNESVMNSLDYLREFPYGCIEQTVNRFFPALQVLAGLRELEQTNKEWAKEIRAIVDDGLARVISMQNQDGGWGWFNGNASNPMLTALCVEALSTAWKLDLPVPERTIARGQEFLIRLLQSQRGSIDRFTATGLMALAASNGLPRLDRSGFVIDWATRLRGAITQASADVLAPFALACDLVGRRELGAAALETLIRAAQKANVDGLPATYWQAGGDEAGRFSHNGSNVEVTALALAALASYSQELGLQNQAIRWLESQKDGTKWRATRDTALVVRAYVKYLQSASSQAPRGKVNISLNGKSVGSIDVARDRKVLNFSLAGNALLNTLKSGGDNLLTIEGPTGIRFTGGFGTVVSANEIEPRSDKLSLSRRYTLGPDAVRRISRGAELFERLPQSELTAAQVNAVGEGELVNVILSITSATSCEEIIVEDPLPAGLEPVSKTVSGASRFEHRDGKAVLFFERLSQGTTTVSYTARALRVGRYRARPAMVSLMYFPEVWARSSDQRFAVLTAAERNAQIRASIAARALMLRDAANDARAAGKLEQAQKFLREFLSLDGLRADVLGEARRNLLSIAMTNRDLTQIREHIDALNRLAVAQPSFTLAELVLAGEAYLKADPSQALGYYRAAIDVGYNRAVNALMLEPTPTGQAQALTRLLNRMPDAPKVYADWMLVAELAAKGAPAAERDAVYVAELKHAAAEAPRSEVNRRSLALVLGRLMQANRYKDARRMAEAWLNYLPSETEPLADEVLVVAAMASFELHAYKDVKEFASKLYNGRYLNVSPDQVWLEPASLAEWKRTNPRDVYASSRHRGIAANLLGQLAHAAGDLKEAVRWYREAPTDDARLALSELTRVEFDVPQFVKAKPGETATLAVTGRNLTTAEVAVYPFDLLYCFTVRKHLRDLHTIDLTGLKPAQTLSVNLSRAGNAENDYTAFTTPIALGKLDKGAYLVLVKAGDRVQSSIVIVSDLEAVAKTDNGVLRIHVTADGKPVADAKVRVSDGSRIVAAGSTDIRGIFQAANGDSVLVERAGEYALIPRVR